MSLSLTGPERTSHFAQVVDKPPDLAVTVSVARMQSKSRNTPFDGWALRGGVAATIVGGRTVYVNEETGLGLKA